MPHLDTLEIEPDSPATAAVIWMHGLGADARDFYSIPPQLGLPTDLSIRFVFPNAPRIPVTINMGTIMPAWYDVSGFDRKSLDARGIRRSAEHVSELVGREVDRGVEAHRIVLAGFSQGGAMALFAGVRYPETLGGLMCLSGYLPLDEELAEIAQSADRKPPVFQAHGTSDPLVSHAVGRKSCAALQDAGYDVEWHEYAMGHQVCLEEVADIGRWLSRALADIP